MQQPKRPQMQLAPNSLQLHQDPSSRSSSSQQEVRQQQPPSINKGAEAAGHILALAGMVGGPLVDTARHQAVLQPLLLVVVVSTVQ